MSALGAPVKVSPLIKFARWSFLGAGVTYGMFHQSRLARREVGIREVEAKQKIIRDEKLAIEKKIASEQELKDFAEWTK